MKFLRWKAKQMGWTLNEYGMGKKYTPVDANPNGFQVSLRPEPPPIEHR